MPQKRPPFPEPEGFAWCYFHEALHPVNDFYWNNSNGRTCKDRAVAVARQWRADNGEQKKHARRKSNYNLSPEEYVALLASQDGCCAVCGRDTPGKHDWHIDHDHSCCPQRSKSCGKCIRGLLCSPCNVGLGMFQDRVEVLQRAIAYLAR